MKYFYNERLVMTKVFSLKKIIIQSDITVMIELFDGERYLLGIFPDAQIFLGREHQIYEIFLGVGLSLTAEQFLNIDEPITMLESPTFPQLTLTNTAKIILNIKDQLVVNGRFIETSIVKLPKLERVQIIIRSEFTISCDV